MTDEKLSLPRLGLLAFLLAAALVLRLKDLDAFLTTDENAWHGRSLDFARALSERNWAATYQTGHPGVVTMWLGTAAQHLGWLQQPTPFVDSVIPETWRSATSAEQQGTGVPPLTLGARRLVALSTWLCIVALFPLVRKLFGARVGLLAVALVGLDPFFLAHSRFHHLDGLLTAFCAVSILSLLVYQFRGRQPGYLAASAAAAGLALANKSPGIMLAPWAAVALLVPPLLRPALERKRALLGGAANLALWGVMAASVLFVIWPAMWVEPMATLQKVFGVAMNYAETPHEYSNYFWFAQRADPGPGFYPVVWAFRSSPWVFPGLLTLVLPWRRRENRTVIVMMLLWAALFGAAMTVGAKKGDRYLLPVFPVLAILSALGLAALVREAASRLDRRWLRPATAALIGGLVAGQLALTVSTAPYYLSYYNPIVGGGRMAPRVLLIGWGEGLDRAAAYLNGKPDASQLVVYSPRWAEFAPFFDGQTARDVEACSAWPDYSVLYSNMLQRDLISDAAWGIVGVQEPEYVVSINGIEYAWVYANAGHRESEEEVLGRISAMEGGENALVLLDGNTSLARTYEGPLAVKAFPTTEREDAALTELQALTAGYEHVWHVTYDGELCGTSDIAKEELQRRGMVGAETGAGGVHAVRYDLRDGDRFVPDEPSVAAAAHFSGMTLLGYDVCGGELQPGESFCIRLYWQADRPVAENLTVFVQLFGPDGVMYGQLDSLPQGGARRTDSWRPGEIILDDHVVEVSPMAPPGEYEVLVGLYDLVTMKRVPAVDAVGMELPDDASRLTGLSIDQPTVQ